MGNRQYTNEEMFAILEKIDTGSLAGGGLLNPEQSKQFFKQVFDKVTFIGKARHELRKAKQGEIDKVAIGGRLLRKKVEDTDDNYRAGVATSKIEYRTTAVRLPWELTEETLRENIEGESFEDTVMNLMTTQTGIDLEDLAFNGDAFSDDPFLSIQDGWLKKIAAAQAAHKVNGATFAQYDKAIMFAMAQALPNKYKGTDVSWIMSPNRKLKWVEYLTERPTGAGDAALLGAGDQVNKPLGYGIELVPSLPDDILILANPKNFINVNTYDIRIRKTTEGKEAVMQDKRFYVVHFDNDSVIQEMDAIAYGYNVPMNLAEN